MFMYFGIDKCGKWLAIGLAAIDRQTCISRVVIERAGSSAINYPTRLALYVRLNNEHSYGILRKKILFDRELTLKWTIDLWIWFPTSCPSAFQRQFGVLGLFRAMGMWRFNSGR
jgi:hypothetical protein